MAKKHYDIASSNNFANMPQDVIRKEYPKKGSAIKDGSYVDTCEGLDNEFNKAIGRVGKMQR